MNRKTLWIVALIILGLIAWVWAADDTNGDRGQETCPKDAPWVKVDDLSGFSYTFDVPDGYTVTDNCYKASTNVVYGSGDTVETDDKFELSHASFKLEKLPDIPDDPEEPEEPEEPETPEEPEVPVTPVVPVGK